MIGHNQPLVSILMNCYNSEKYLKEAIDSIYNQTYSNFEIIFVDNCSTDNSAKIAKTYDNRLKYHETPQKMSLYSARAFGQQFIKGDFLTFLDCDDIWLPSKLEIQVNKMIKRPDINFLYTRVSYIFESENSIKKIMYFFYNLMKSTLSFLRLSGFISKKDFLLKYDIILQSVMIRTSQIGEVAFSKDLNLYGDFDFFLKLYWNNSVIPYFMNNKTTFYRIHPNQLSKKSHRDWFDEANYLMKESYSKLFSDKEVELFDKGQLKLHQAHNEIENNNRKKGLKILWTLTSNGISYKIHFLKVLIFSLKT